MPAGSASSEPDASLPGAALSDASLPDAAAVDGLVVVDKPAGMTSHDVVARLRRIAHTRRVGHAGTLDPMATGVLVLGVNRGTRLLHHLVLTNKVYTATIRLGIATVTDDAQGAVLTTASAAAVSENDVCAALPALTGAIQQIPSSVSAIKVDGQRSYARVRAGEDVVLAARPVTVHRFEALRFARPARVADADVMDADVPDVDVLDVDVLDVDVLDVDVLVECSSGTYVRALARDLGTALGVGGHLTALRRTRVGPFSVDSASTLAALDEPGGLRVVGLSEAIGQAMPVRTVDAAEQRELSFGRSLTATGIEGVHGAVAADGTAVALLQEIDGRAGPVLVFTPAG